MAPAGQAAPGMDPAGRAVRTDQVRDPADSPDRADLPDLAHRCFDLTGVFPKSEGRPERTLRPAFVVNEASTESGSDRVAATRHLDSRRQLRPGRYRSRY